MKQHPLFQGSKRGNSMNDSQRNQLLGDYLFRGEWKSDSKKKITQIPKGIFHITIGVTPPENLELSLSNDLRMVKSALLYADKIKLCSFLSQVILNTLTLENLSIEKKISFFTPLIPLFNSDPTQIQSMLTATKRYQSLVKKKHLNREELLFTKKFEKMLKVAWEQTIEMVGNIRQLPGASEIELAIKSGIVEVHDFGKNPQAGDIVNEYVNIVADAFNTTSTYPLLDASTTNLLHLGKQANVITLQETTQIKGKQVTLASNLFERLPTFEMLTTDEILDVRKELAQPLIRFRGAVAQFSEKIKSEIWDDDFPTEIELLIRKDIEPAISQLEDAVKSNKYLATLRQRFVDKPVLAVPYFIILTVAKAAMMPELAAQAFGTGVAATLIFGDAYREWQQKKENLMQNHLFFLYKVKNIKS